MKVPDSSMPSYELAQRSPPPAEPIPSRTTLLDPASVLGPGEDRWRAAVTNLQEAGNLVDSLQPLLLSTAVYADEPTFSQASSVAYAARMIKAQDRRIKALQKEVDAAILAAARARAQVKEAETSQRAAEERAAVATEDLNNSTVVFESHSKALREMSEDVAKKDEEIRMLKAIIQTLSEKSTMVRPDARRYS